MSTVGCAGDSMAAAPRLLLAALTAASELRAASASSQQRVVRRYAGEYRWKELDAPSEDMTNSFRAAFNGTTFNTSTSTFEKLSSYSPTTSLSGIAADRVTMWTEMMPDVPDTFVLGLGPFPHGGQIIFTATSDAPVDLRFELREGRPCEAYDAACDVCWSYLHCFDPATQDLSCQSTPEHCMACGLFLYCFPDAPEYSTYAQVSLAANPPISYSTASITVNGELANYSIALPIGLESSGAVSSAYNMMPQKTFLGLVMYVLTDDTPVSITGVRVAKTGAPYDSLHMSPYLIIQPPSQVGVADDFTDVGEELIPRIYDANLSDALYPTSEGLLNVEHVANTYMDMTTPNGTQTCAHTPATAARLHLPLCISLTSCPWLRAALQPSLSCSAV